MRGSLPGWGKAEPRGTRDLGGRLTIEEMEIRLEPEVEQSHADEVCSRRATRRSGRRARRLWDEEWEVAYLKYLSTAIPELKLKKYFYFFIFLVQYLYIPFLGIY